MARYDHTAWTPHSLPNSIVLLGGSGGYYSSTAELTAEIVPGNLKAFIIIIFFPGGATFQHEHCGFAACGIPDGDSIVLTGGGDYYNFNLNPHNYTTRWVCAKSSRPTNVRQWLSLSWIIITIRNQRNHHLKDIWNHHYRYLFVMLPPIITIIIIIIVCAQCDHHHHHYLKQDT